MFTQFLETVPDAMVVVDRTGVIRFINHATEVMFGFLRAELIGKTLDLLMPAATQAQHVGHVRSFVAAPQRRVMGVNQALSARRKDGSEFPVGIALTPLELEGTQYVAAAIRDVTEHRRAARQTSEREEQLLALGDLSHAGTWELDFATGVRTFSAELVAQLGLSQATFSPEQFFARVHPDDVAGVQARATAAERGGELEPGVIRFKHGDESEHWLQVRGLVQRSVSGAPLRMLVMAIDVTARYRSEEQLRQVEAQQRQVLEALPNLVAIIDQVGTVLYLNHSIHLKKEEALNRTVFEHLDPEMGQVVQRALDQALAGTPAEFETAMVHRGAPVWYASSLRLISQRGPPRLLLISSDITAQRTSQSELADFRVAMENAVEGFARVDLEGRFASANLAYAQMLGYEPEELVGVDWATTFSGEESGTLSVACAQLAAAGRAELEVMGVRKDGSLFPKAVTMISAKDTGGRLRGHYCFMRDISEHRRSREQLLISDRMASVGILAAGVAHEINNPLAAVISNLHVAQRDLATLETPQRADLQDGLADAIEAAGRVRQIVRDLKVFSRPDDLNLSPVAVQQVMESSLRMARNEIRHRAQLVTDYKPVPLVLANEARLGQVFLNLVVNAAQAIPEGNAGANEIRITTSVDAKGRVVIEVEDTGPGIPPEVRGKLFVPFFTTKPVGVGTGLGLSICHRIITGFNGEIEVDSTVGKGTTFRVLLPAAEGAPAPSPEGKTPGVRRGARGRVLVVDDDVLVGVAIQRCLSGAHDIVVVTRSADALSLVASGQRFDVILCDLMMPQMTGMEFHTELATLIPDQAARVVFVTGGAFTPGAREFLDKATNQRLEKPFDPVELQVLVNAWVR